MVELRVPYASSRAHVLYASTRHVAFVADAVLMGEYAIHHKRDNLHVAMGMLTEASLGLDQIVVHHTQHTKV